MGFIKEFKEFAMRGNVLDMAHSLHSLIKPIPFPPVVNQY